MGKIIDPPLITYTEGINVYTCIHLESHVHRHQNFYFCETYTPKNIKEKQDPKYYLSLEKNKFTSIPSKVNFTDSFDKCLLNTHHVMDIVFGAE